MISEVPMDAIITLFVFLVGIPALLLQTLPAETRLLLTKRWWRLFGTVAWPIALALAIVLAGFVASRQFGVTAWIWGTVLGLLFAIVGITAFRLPRSYGGRDALVGDLKNEAACTLDENCRLVEDPLSDLIELGKQSRAGREKEWVLNALLDLAHRVTSHSNYEGDALEDVILGTVNVLGHLPHEHSSQNLATGASILRTVVMRYEAPEEKPTSQADLISSIRASSALGRIALLLDNPAVTLGIVQACGGDQAGGGESLTSQTLFEIGVAAIDHDQMLIAMASLSRLVTLIAASSPAGGDLAADALGLVAHFWAVGPSGRDYAGERLAQLEPYLDREMKSAIDAAAAHSVRITNFNTSDLLRDMGASLARAQLSSPA